jgi:hypothetical protein
MSVPLMESRQTLPDGASPLLFDGALPLQHLHPKSEVHGRVQVHLNRPVSDAWPRLAFYLVNGSGNPNEPHDHSGLRIHPLL